MTAVRVHVTALDDLRCITTQPTTITMHGKIDSTWRYGARLLRKGRHGAVRRTSRLGRTAYLNRVQLQQSSHDVKTYRLSRARVPDDTRCQSAGAFSQGLDRWPQRNFTGRDSQKICSCRLQLSRLSQALFIAHVLAACRPARAAPGVAPSRGSWIWCTVLLGQKREPSRRDSNVRLRTRLFARYRIQGSDSWKSLDPSTAPT
jgi:hypothetical protein